MGPYQPLRVTDLERLFAGAEGDRGILDALMAELGHRRTQSAEKLRERVEKALEGPAERHDAGAGEASRSSSRAASLDDEEAATASRRPDEPPPWSNPGPRSPPPPVRDRPEDVLSAWTALEVLSPMTYRKPADMADGDQKRIASLAEAMPWQPPGERSKPKKQLFYQVVLGAVRMDEATNALLSVFVDKHADRRGGAGLAALATLTLDKAGIPVAEGEATVISSFAWGCPSPCGVICSAWDDGRTPRRD
ncbi:hypothetical protein Maq22A_1p36070 (plasmid) [Methylobacterium aquaticum]|uniref:Uncharacterized protein n=1 Tax=Methylobacterium aquaticum TaxID=270351 RepID=A0A0C6F9G1_9HYPH|nr:hypothetical protein Maq22A_1p36070 [Methylobacterium aquaticum]